MRVRTNFGSGSRPIPPAATYGVAFLSVALAFVVRWLLDPFLGSQLQLGPVYGAIAIAVWFGGWRPALAATIIGYIGAQYLFAFAKRDRTFAHCVDAACWQRAGLSQIVSKCPKK